MKQCAPPRSRRWAAQARPSKWTKLRKAGSRALRGAHIVGWANGAEGERVIHTNTVEGYYSIFKRGMRGIYQHCSEKHLHRYLSEYDFRYSYRVRLGYSDAMRADKALEGIRGKRLTYRRPNASKTIKQMARGFLRWRRRRQTASDLKR